MFPIYFLPSFFISSVNYIPYLRSEKLELTVETEVNGDSKRTNERGPSLVGSLDFSCRYKRLLFCLGCSSRPSTKYFFLTVHYLNSFVPIAQQAGQAAVLGRLSLSVSLSLRLPILLNLSLSVSLCLRLLIWLNLLFVQVRCTHPDERIPGGHLGRGARQQRGTSLASFPDPERFGTGSGYADP